MRKVNKVVAHNNSQTAHSLWRGLRPLCRDPFLRREYYYFRLLFILCIHFYPSVVRYVWLPVVVSFLTPGPHLHPFRSGSSIEDSSRLRSYGPRNVDRPPSWKVCIVSRPLFRTVMFTWTDQGPRNSLSPLFLLLLPPLPSTQYSPVTDPELPITLLRPNETLSAPFGDL